MDLFSTNEHVRAVRIISMLGAAMTVLLVALDQNGEEVDSLFLNEDFGGWRALVREQCADCLGRD